MIKNWLLLFFWASLIFFLSHQPDLKSNLPVSLDFTFRKTVHFLEYAILTWFSFRAFGENKSRALVVAVIFSVLYAFSDEWHQSFIPGRQPSLRDIGIDNLGALFSAWLIKWKMLK